MSKLEEIGNIVQKRHDEIDIEWEIADFFFVSENKKEIKCLRFLFVETPWRLQLKFKSDLKPGSMCLFIRRMKSFDDSVKYNFGLKNRDGVVELLSKGILESKQSFKNQYIKLSELQQRKSDLMPYNALIIACTLKLEIPNSDKAKELDRPNVNKLIKLETLSANLKSLSVNKENCDVTLHIQDKEYKAHKAILIARSSVFAAMFQHETSEKKSGIINIPDCDPESFKEFLEFLYCGKLEELPPCKVLHLYKISDKYDIQELKTFCSEFLMENLTVENLCEIVILADKYDDTKLLSAAQCFFNKNLNKVFESSEWVGLMTNNRRLANNLLLEMSKMKAVD